MSSQDRIVEDLIRDKDDVKLQVLSERIFNKSSSKLYGHGKKEENEENID